MSQRSLEEPGAVHAAWMPRGQVLLSIGANVGGGTLGPTGFLGDRSLTDRSIHLSIYLSTYLPTYLPS